MRKSFFKNATLGLIILTFVSKVLGFVREIVISYIYGASAMSDAYSMANSIAVLIVTGLAMGVMTAYIPESMLIDRQDEKNEFTSNILNFVLVGFGTISVLCIVFAKPIVSIMGVGFSSETKTYTEILLRFVLLASICIFVIYIISGFLNVHNNFFYNGLQLIITNLIIIIAVILSKDNPMSLGMGYLIAYIVPLILGMFIMKHYNFKYTSKLKFDDKHLKNVCVVSLIAFLGTNVVKLNVMLDRVFASSLQEGAVAAINYAFTLTSIVPEVFALSMITVLYPELSQLYVRKEYDLFGRKVAKLLAQIILILVPVTIIFLTEGDWIVQFLFQRGAFDEQASNLTVQVLRGYSLGMLPIGISFVLCKVFFARKEELIPTICLGISIVLNFLFDLVTSGQALIELTSFTTVSITLATVGMLFILIKKKAILRVNRLAVTFLKSISSGIIMMLLIGGMRRYSMVLFAQNGIVIRFLILTVVTFIAGMAYMIVMFILREETLLEELSRIKSRLGEWVER